MDQNQTLYKPLTLTFVEYKSGDYFGFVMAWFSMLPIFYAISLATLIVIRRDLTTIFYFIGFLLTEATNMVLKNVIKQPRPVQERNRGSFSKYGMPSDHSQIMFYFSTFFSLIIIFRYYVNNNSLVQIFFKNILIIGSFLAAFLVAYSRVYLEYHTFDQVAVGAIVGVLLGCIWFFAVHNIFSNYFHFITTCWISEFFMIRDYTHIPNVLLFQYTAERNEAHVRRKNKIN